MRIFVLLIAIGLSVSTFAVVPPAAVAGPCDPSVGNC
ncbi:hypothetical protein H4W29_003905 [Rhizobium viscosum]|uniref:Porin n=1 Tax=Rhizobium viscosum TaxID=1673 RepID=A0ABR9IU46_RHIVS|nr:hypothetical protein [Rhizobium viscosum]